MYAARWHGIMARPATWALLALLVWAPLLAAAVRVLDVSPARSASRSSPIVAASTGVAGLRATLRIPPGPYFLSELLDATVVLSNHSRRSLILDGPPTAGICGSPIWVTLRGGASPFFTLHYFLQPSCPAPMPATIAPGRIVTVHLLVPLTASGRVVLLAQGSFLRRAWRSGYIEYTTAPDPLAGHWPALAVRVAPRVPADRALAVRLQDHTLLVYAPARARARLLYQYSFTCASYGGGKSWTPLHGAALDEPACADDTDIWAVDVAAPQFATADRVYCSPRARPTWIRCSPG